MIEEPEIKKYYDARAQTYYAIFNSTYFKIHDLITWKCARALTLAERGSKITFFSVTEKETIEKVEEIT